MIHLLSKYLPYLLLIYVLYRSIKSPIYLLGVALLIKFKYSVFFENVKIFAIPGSLNKDVLFLIWLFLIWLMFSNWPFFHKRSEKISYYNYKGSNWINLPIYGLIIISFLGLFSVLNEYLLIKNVFSQFLAMISLFIGYFIVKDIVRYTEPEALKEFLYTIVLINSLASLLYILHQGLHITIYVPPWTEFEPQQELFDGQTVTREFWCMPVLWFFTIAYLIVFRKEKNVINIILLIINFLAIFVSYTRSFAGIGLFILFLYFFFVSYKSKNLSGLIKNLIATIFIITALSFTIYYVFPKKVDYFVSRINEVKENPQDETSNDLLSRFAATGAIFHRMDRDRLITGMGPVSETQVSWVEDMRATTADMAWTAVVFRWGYLGLSFFIFMFLFSLIKAFKLFMQTDKAISQLGLVLLLTIISQILESFVSATFMYDERLPLGLWYLGILSALLGFDKKYQTAFKTDEKFQLS